MFNKFLATLTNIGLLEHVWMYAWQIQFGKKHDSFHIYLQYLDWYIYNVFHVWQAVWLLQSVSWHILCVTMGGNL
jgi:hypothetical protein